MDADPGLFASLVQNLLGLVFFGSLGALAGVAFPFALLCRRMLDAAERARDRVTAHQRALAYAGIIAACGMVPWASLSIGRWVEGSNIASTHALEMIAGSACAMSYLLRRWQLFGDGRIN